MSVFFLAVALLQTTSAMTDYPIEAVAHGWEGTAVAELSIDADGHVSSCRIMTSTGHKVLDDATCEQLLHQAIFKPARDDSGKPIASKFTTPPITWRLGN